MNFAFSEEQEQFREMLRSFVSERTKIAEVRKHAESESGFDPAVWRTMCDELGLAGLAVPEEHGGQGFGMLELGIALEELGRELAGGPLFAATALGIGALQQIGTTAEQAELLPPLASGEQIATLADGEATCSARDGKLSGSVRHVIDAQNATYLLVSASDEQGTGLYWTAADAPGLRLETSATLDLVRKTATVTLSDTPARRLAEGDASAALARVRDRAIIALGAEQIGAAQRCLEMAVAHIKERFQFGRPIGSFQAVKHRAADVYASIELARSVAYWSWWVAETESDELVEAAGVVKSLCSAAAEQAAKDNIHLHGGMGFTWEHDAHLYFRRARASEMLFMDPTQARARLAKTLGVAA